MQLRTKLITGLLLVTASLSAQKQEIIGERMGDTIFINQPVQVQEVLEPEVKTKVVADSLVCLPASELTLVADNLKSLILADSLKTVLLAEQQINMDAIDSESAKLRQFSLEQRDEILGLKKVNAILDRKRRAKNKKMWATAGIGALIGILITN